MKTSIEDKRSFVKFYDSLKEQFEIHKAEYEGYKAEIVELENKTPAPLTFLQLAEKYQRSLLDLFEYFKRNTALGGVQLCEQYAIHTKENSRCTKQQARKFVAEIYLTLLAKELNGENVDDTTRFHPYMAINTSKIYYDFQANHAYGGVWFKDGEVFHKALIYSLEAETMWLWYFGKEEAK